MRLRRSGTPETCTEGYLGEWIDLDAEFDRQAKTRLTIGRNAKCDLVLADTVRLPQLISRAHATFERDESGGLYVMDAESRNGLWVSSNGFLQTNRNQCV